MIKSPHTAQDAAESSQPSYFVPSRKWRIYKAKYPIIDADLPWRVITPAGFTAFMSRDFGGVQAFLNYRSRVNNGHWY